MTNKKFIEKEGIVTETLPGGKFRIKLDDRDVEAVGYISGKIRHFNIKIIPGDRVKAEFSKYDDKNCRIVYRYK